MVAAAGCARSILAEANMVAKKNGPKRAGKTKTKKVAEAKAAAPQKPKRVTALDAAARVLAEEGKAMSCGELIEKMAAKKYWTSPGGRTPASTLYAAMAREIKTKGNAARFRKTDRGKFAGRATK
jgi:HB1/ASXL restriction endonuclease-like protein with HTH domain